MRRALRTLSRHEQVNFLLTNRIPRRALTRLFGWLSRIENPWLVRQMIVIWQVFADDMNLDEAETRAFTSLQACFTRRLKPGARPPDPRPDIVASPCDAVVGECGRIAGGTIFQAKGFPYELGDLIPDVRLQRPYQDGCYVTLRLKSSMYHRFHAPVDCAVGEIHYICGDTWNVNPIALKRIEKLYCRNERAVVPLQNIATTGNVCMVPIAAILVASLKFSGLEQELDLRYRGPNRIAWNSRFSKGDEMGYFQHGSTIILLASGNYVLQPGVCRGALVRVGQALLTDTGITRPHHPDDGHLIQPSGDRSP